MNPKIQESAKDLLERLQRFQKSFKAKVLDNPKFKWYQRGVWAVTLSYAAYLAIQSIPYYTAIGEGESLYKAGQYPEAERKFKAALLEAEKFSPTDLRKAKVMNNLAELYRQEARYPEGLHMYEGSLEIARKLPKTRPELALSLHNLATLYRDMGRYADAEKTYAEALSVWDREIKKDDLNRAALLNGIGKLKRDEGRYPEAEKYYKQALAIKQKLLGGSDVELAAVLDNLGGVYRDEGRFKESEAMYNKALLIDRTVLGKDHPYVGTDLNNLAGLYRDEKRYKEARPLYEQGLAIRKQALGDKHALVAKSYSGLAELESAQGNYKQALKLLQQAHDIQNRSYFNNPHPDTATTLDLLGNAYLNLGDIKSAKIALDQCVSMRQKVLAANHPDLGVALIDRARCEHDMNDEVNAEKDFAQGKEILIQALGTDHPLTRRMLAYKV